MKDNIPILQDSQSNGEDKEGKIQQEVEGAYGMFVNTSKYLYLLY